MKSFAAPGLCLLLAGLTFSLAGTAQQSGPDMARAELRDSLGKKVGTVSFLEKNDGVVVTLRAESLPPGLHGLHVHEKGKCTGPDFKSAGDHFAPETKDHGIKSPTGPHAGDLPNIQVKDDGRVVAEFFNERISLEPGQESLLRSGGTAIVIHSGADDQLTDPSGKSGTRIACGVIERVEKW